MDKKLLMIVNPAAGMGKGRLLEGEIAHMYARYGWISEVRETRAVGDAQAYALSGTNGYDMVMCVGGDGTLSETLNGLTGVKSAPPLCYVPMGSTNDLAMSAGLPRDPMSAAAVGLGGKPMPIDAGLFNDRVFSYVACFGVFSRTSYGTDRELKNRIGHLAYILTGIQEIGHLQSYPVRLDCDGDEISGDFFFGSFCNTKSLGGALKLPLSREDLQDGQHELLMVRKPQRIDEVAGLLATILSGSYNHPLLIYRHAKKAIFHMPQEMPWSLDGEKADAGTRVEIRNMHHAYLLMLPDGQEKRA